jgi:tetratricopeptide (TPR) repeat protein
VADTSGGNQGQSSDDLFRSYRAIPEEDRKRAKVFFDRGKTVAGTGNYEYAIEMYLQGLSVDPENIEAHQTLRDISLKRKVSGGKDMGMLEKMKQPKAKDEKEAMLAAEKLLAYVPGDIARMLALTKAACKAGCYDTVLWIGPICMRTNLDQKKPDFKTFIDLRDTFASIDEYRLASEACYHAKRLKPEDMELAHQERHLAALLTQKEGKYGTAKSFRESMKDTKVQDMLLEQDKDVREEDALARAIKEAELQWKATPDDQARFSKLIEAYRRTDSPQYENRAIELLEDMYQKTRQFKHRQRIGEFKLTQLARQERNLRQQIEKAKGTPNLAELEQNLKEFRVEKAKSELAEYRLIVENYPTDSNARFEVAKRMFMLGDFSESISVFQQVRSDPKHRVDASVLLGRAFLSAGFADESVDTLKAVIDEYPGRGDERSMQMYYWYARSLEEKKETPAAIKAYSQVAQWNFNYLDVQTRIKKLRSAGATPT